MSNTTDTPRTARETPPAIQHFVMEHPDEAAISLALLKAERVSMDISGALGYSLCTLANAYRDATRERDTALAQAAKMREGLLSQVTEALEEAEAGIASERVAGNIVKEEFWKGERSALQCVLTALATKEEPK